MPFRLQIPRPLYEAILAQALAELPNECCGLLAGQVVTNAAEQRIGQVQRRYALTNAAASPVEFLSDPRSMFAADRDIRRLGLEILAVYHSHPTSAPIPSRTDLERNYSPEVMNLIISLTAGEPRVRGWWLTLDHYQEGEWECMEERLDAARDPAS